MVSRRNKLIVSVMLDTLDFFAPPGVEELLDLFNTGVAVNFYGLKGLGAFWEAFEATGAIDRFVPSLTILWFLDKGGS